MHSSKKTILDELLFNVHNIQDVQNVHEGDMMVRINTSEARQGLADLLNRVLYRGERIILHRRGRDVAAIVSLEDLELLERFEDQIDLQDAKKALKEAKKKGTKPLSSVMQELGIER